MPQPVLPGAPILGRAQQLNIHEVRLLPIAGLSFTKGGCDMPGRHIRAEVVDVPHATQYIIPVDIGFAERLHKQLGDLINDINTQSLEK